MTIRCPYSHGTPPPPPLSRREAEIAWFIGHECKDHEIAKFLGVSHRTVNSHRDHILQKLAVRSRVGIALWIWEKCRELPALLAVLWITLAHEITVAVLL